MGLTGAGCATNTQTGALVGGGAGAAVGAVAFRRTPVAGAVLGGAVGALTGAAIGNAQDRAEARERYYDDPPPPPYEAVPPPPFPGAAWHPGYWIREHHEWVWSQGFWS
ncbi:MAG TPA: YMGG-like glycine zipper-containing protein [Tepidisphaeraceae bacterium]